MINIKELWKELDEKAQTTTMSYWQKHLAKKVIEDWIKKNFKVPIFDY